VTWLVRRLVGRLPSTLLLLGLAIGAGGRLVVEVWRRPWLSCPLATLAVVLVVVEPGSWQQAFAVLLGGILGAVTMLGLVVWAWPGSVVGQAWRSWRRRRYYLARWADAVHGVGLVRADVEPVLMSVRSRGGVDELLVHMAPGQLVTEWRDLAPRVAGALEVRSVRVRSAGPRDVVLLARPWVVAIDPGGDRVGVGIEPLEPDEQPATGGAFPRRPR